AAVVALDHEQAAAADREVERVAGLGHRTLVPHRLGAGEPDAAAQALRVELAAEHVGELGAVALVADGGRVGDVVTDDAHRVAVGLEAADPDVEAVRDGHCYSWGPGYGVRPLVRPMVW